MLKDLRQLYNFRELLWAFTVRDLKVRYHQTIFGVLWAVIQPFSFMIVFTVIFTNFASLNTMGYPYPIFSYLTLVPWILFSNSLTTAMASIINNSSLVNKVYFPREVLPLSAFLSASFDFVIAALIFFGMVIFYGVSLSPTALYSFVFIFSLSLITCGLGFFLSAIFVFFRDTRYIIQLVIQLWMYITPIIYPASIVPDKFHRLYFLNPLVSIMEGLRESVLYANVPPLNVILYPLILGIFLIVTGFIFFRKTEKYFSDFI